MDTGAEFQIRLKNKQWRTFCPVGKPGTIARYFWHFFRNLSEEQWEALGSKLVNDVKWYVKCNMKSPGHAHSNCSNRVKGEDEEDAEIKNYNSAYRWGSDERGTQVQDALAVTLGSPAYALNMILQGKLNHMIHVDCEGDEEPEIFKKQAAYSYRADFESRLLYFRPERSNTNEPLHWGKEEGWIRIPFIKAIDNDALTVFEHCRLFKNIKASLQYLEHGPKMSSSGAFQSSNMSEERIH
jgi:hypothetical protein